MRKIGILGGTFDPIHWGHLLMAQMAASQVALDQVIWIPDRDPPHKSRSSLASFEHRWEMVAASIVDRPNFVLSPLLSNPSGTSFAIDTLLYLQNFAPEAQHYWIIGADAFQTLPKWRRCCEIGQLCDWLVAPRPSLGHGEWGSEEVSECEKIQVETNAIGRRVVEQMAMEGVEISWQALAMPAIEISSSQIRRYCTEGRSIEHLVPEAVSIYITAHQLYRS
jgi:nicotinate-nucleotide adenylyltransferase